MWVFTSYTQRCQTLRMLGLAGRLLSCSEAKAFALLVPWPLPRLQVDNNKANVSNAAGLPQRELPQASKM